MKPWNPGAPASPQTVNEGTTMKRRSRLSSKIAKMALVLGTTMGAFATLGAAGTAPAGASLIVGGIPIPIVGGLVNNVAPAPTISGCKADFGSVQVDASEFQFCTISNADGIFSAKIAESFSPAATTFEVLALTTSGPGSGPPFCDGTLAAGASCQIEIGFYPPKTGPLSSTLTVSATFLGSITNSTSLHLTGIGLAKVPIYGCNGGFGSETIGLVTPAQTCIFTNTSATPGVFSLFPKDGTIDPDEFAIEPQSSCTTLENATGDFTLEGDDSCTDYVEFAPVFVGSAALPINFVNVADPGFTIGSVTFAGTGTQGVIKNGPTLFQCDGQFDTYTSAGDPVVEPCELANYTGKSAVMAVAIAPFNPDFSVTSSGGTCGDLDAITLANNANCTFSVIFDPTAAGNYTGQMTLVNKTVGGGSALQLSGGTDPY
jgi:hypothetical protein